LNLSALAVLLAAVVSLPVLAQGTHLWTQSRLEEFEKGVQQGVALTSDGQLREGPGLTEMLTTPSTYVWSVAVDKSGTVYAGTASPATVLRIGPDHKPFTLFETKDLAVQVVRVGPDGSLYAAVLPSGKVYRLKADNSTKQEEAVATVVFDSAKAEGEKAAKEDGAKSEAKSHFIWDMTFDAAGRLYIATGGPAAIYRVDPAKPDEKPETFFKTDEQHVRCFTWDAKGNLIAGTDGSGLVYRIGPEGKGYVLFDAPRREITSVAVGADGTIYAASVGDKSHNPLPPLPVQGAGMATITIIQPGSLQAANSSTTLPEGTEIYALTQGQAPRKLWSQKDEIVYELAARPEGLLALTGNRGHIFRIAPDGSFADIGHLEAQQGLSLAVGPAASGQPGNVVIGTGNTGKIYELGTADKHEYASDVLDAGALARFGRVEVEPGSAGYDIWTRTGNVEQPVRGRNDWGWADWQPLKDGSVASPPGRYLQWKAVLGPGGHMGSVGVNYLPVNSSPVVDDLVVVTGARVTAQNMPSNQSQNINIQFPTPGQSATAAFDSTSNMPLQATKDRTAVTVRWAAHDDDGDDLTYSLFLRGDGETVWRLLKDKIADKVYSFDATLIPDGGYQIKLVASDAPSHTPGEALSGSKVSDRFEVDTTPPVIKDLKATGEKVDCESSHCPRPFNVTFDAVDASSPIAHAEYSLDAGPWQYVNPVGELSDSKREHYEIQIPLAVGAGNINEHLITVRAYDRQENVGVAKTVIHAEDMTSPAKASQTKPSHGK
jgi:hypothetical protein